LAIGASTPAVEKDRTAGVKNIVPRVVAVNYVRDYTLRVRFADGVEGEIDLAAELDGEIFQPLRERDYFQQVRVNPELHTIVWPNGADFAPEFLYDRIRVVA
jgi:hypothetical protein